MRTDVAIAGAGFAGLGLAYYLKESGMNSLLVDKRAIGSHRSSACGMPEYLAGQLAPSSILHSVDTVCIETNRLRRSVRLPERYCTVDYSGFCRSVFRNSGARFLKAEVRGGTSNSLDTSLGRIDADFVADCTGWARVLSKGSPRPRRIITAMEITVPIRKEHEGRLNFFVDKGTVPGYGWIFPVGKGMGRVGAGGGCGSVPVSKYFMKFLERVGIPFEPSEITGGGIPCSGLRPAYENGIFFVGDSASQVLPLSAEGIKPTFYFAKECAFAIAAAHSGAIGRAQAAQAYSRKTSEASAAFTLLHAAQEGMLAFPQPFFDAGLWLAFGPLKNRFLEYYLSIARP
ncbi:Digeranylgeranylglycerophospholipid reductase [uncultured archaeon]|nr:Digeranylgeranylglycerophospholipid reductase [uncultured archaeon]